MQKRSKFQIRSDAAKQRWVRDDRKEAYWRKHITAQKQSGMSKRGYCKTNNLPESSFNAWAREIELRDREKIAPAHVAALTETVSNSPNPFVPLRLLADVPAQDKPQQSALASSDCATNGYVEILVPGGAVIQFHADCSADFLAQLFHALKS